MPSSRKLPDYRCPNCGEMFRPPRAISRYCSRPCMWANNGGQNAAPVGEAIWWVSAKGYECGRVLGADGKRRSIRKNRWVVEQHLGRTLTAHEVVHHINGDKLDNRIENLELMTRGEHSTHHNTERDYLRGYKLRLTDEERLRRSAQMRRMRANGFAKAEGGDHD